MHTLLMRLMGPMQSWGVQSRFGMRDTGREPSKSGVIGLLCAALGCPRSAPLDDLIALRMGVRIDREGHIEMDFHTAGIDGFYRAKGDIERKNPIISRRYYLADAAFLVGLQSDELDLLRHLHNALRDPTWPLYLGRKAFVPSPPIWLKDGLKEGVALDIALETYPPLCRIVADKIRLVIDDSHGEAMRPDLPLSFAKREFATKRVCTSYISPPTG